MVVYGDGGQSRDFTYVDDVARGTIAGLKPLGYEVINLGSDAPVVLMDMIHLVEELTGKKPIFIINRSILQMYVQPGQTSDGQSNSWGGARIPHFGMVFRRL